MSKPSSITHSQLKNILSYDKDTGVFTWRKYMNSRAAKGGAAGLLHPNGYRYVRTGGRAYREHRLAFFYVTGRWPDSHIDHINGIKNDNRYSNLREATPSQNQQNRGLMKNNKSGITGVWWEGGKWKVMIKLQDERKYLGRYDDIFSAACARKSAENKYFGAFSYAG